MIKEVLYSYARSCLSVTTHYSAIRSLDSGAVVVSALQSLAHIGVILVCHLSQVIKTDHSLIKTCVVTVRALEQINRLGHLFQY